MPGFVWPSDLWGRNFHGFCPGSVPYDFGSPETNGQLRLADLPVRMARMTCCTCIMRIRIVSIRIYQLWGLKCCGVTLTKWVATPPKQVRSQMVHGQLWLWVAILKRDSSHSHRSRCCNGYNCCERAVLLWATAVAPSAGPKCGSKWTSKVFQQPTHGYMVSLIPQHVEWGKTFDAG